METTNNVQAALTAIEEATKLLEQAQAAYLAAQEVLKSVDLTGLSAVSRRAINEQPCYTHIFSSTINFEKEMQMIEIAKGRVEKFK